MGCQPGDFAYDHFNLPPGLCVGIYGLTYSLYHPEGIKVAGSDYNCMEQFLMEANALYFSDHETAAAIMNTTDPVQQKRLGKSVRN